MKWSGETESQRRKRLMAVHAIYAYLPTQTNSGTWVWLDWVYCVGHPYMNGGLWFEYAEKPDDLKSYLTTLSSAPPNLAKR